MYLLSMLQAVVLLRSRIRDSGHLLYLTFSSCILHTRVEVEGIVPFIESHADKHVSIVGILNPQHEIATAVDTAFYGTLHIRTHGKDVLGIVGI